MTVNIIASLCPAVQTFSGLIRKVDVYSGASVPPVAFTIPQTGHIITSPVNANGWSADMAGRYGTGLIGIGTGLVITAAGTLAISISAGHAMIDGPVEIPAAYPISGLPDNTAKIWIWLKQNGTPVAVATSTTPPAAMCCLLGCVTTVSGAVTVIDTSGVMYLFGGIGHRFTSDAGVPTDTPPANVSFFHLTPFGTFKAEGGLYKSPPPPSVAADPTSTQEGMTWFNNASSQLKVWTGGSAVVLTGTPGVTSVGLSGSAVFSVSGSPVTGSGTIALALATQAANTLLVGPASGGPTAPTFRTLATADLPTTAVTAGTYGNATHTGQFTVDATGRITSASSTAIVVAMPLPASAVNDTSSASSVGTSSDYARSDHVHKAVHTLNTLAGDVTLSAGAGITLTPSGSNIAIASSVTQGPPTNALVISPAGSFISWATPAAVTEFNAGATTTGIYRAQHDLTNCTQARIVYMISTGITLPVTDPTLAAQYFDTTTSSWLYLDGVSGPSDLYSIGTNVSAWVTLTALARADVLLRIVGSGGDGITADQYGSIYLQVR